jgi:hypothetical protein
MKKASGITPLDCRLKQYPSSAPSEVELIPESPSDAPRRTPEELSESGIQKIVEVDLVKADRTTCFEADVLASSLS